MLVLDTSGALAAIDRAAAEHDAAKRVLAEETGPILLSPFVLAELDYMLLTRIGLRAELTFLRRWATASTRSSPPPIRTWVRRRTSSGHTRA